MSDMTNQVSELDRYVEEHVQTSLTELARLCSQPSISAQGIGMQTCAGLVAELLSSRGIAAQIVETQGYPIIVGEAGTGDHTLLLYNHYDVQPPEPLDLWDTPPFEPVQRDGRFFARGAVDDK